MKGEQARTEKQPEVITRTKVKLHTLQPQNASPGCIISQVRNEINSWPPSFRCGEAAKKNPSAAASVVPWKALFAVTSHNWTGGDSLCVLASSPAAAVQSLRVANIKHSSATDWLIRWWNGSKADAAEFIPLELEYPWFTIYTSHFIFCPVHWLRPSLHFHNYMTSAGNKKTCITHLFYQSFQSRWTDLRSGDH